MPRKSGYLKKSPRTYIVTKTRERNRTNAPEWEKINCFRPYSGPLQTLYGYPSPPVKGEGLSSCLAKTLCSHQNMEENCKNALEGTQNQQFLTPSSCICGHRTEPLRLISGPKRAKGGKLITASNPTYTGNWDEIQMEALFNGREIMMRP